MNAWMAAVSSALAWCWAMPPGTRPRAERAGLLRTPTVLPTEPSGFPDPPPALILDLVAAVLDAGLPPPSVLRHVSRALRTSAGPHSPLADALEREARHLEGDLESDLVGGDGGRGGGGVGGGHGVGGGWVGIGGADGVGDRDGVGAAGAGRRGRSKGAREDVEGTGWAVLRGPLGLAAATGVAPAEPVRRAAAEQRRRDAAGRAQAMRRLEVLLVLPTGLCLLPAFVLLGVAPVVIDLFLAR